MEGTNAGARSAFPAIGMALAAWLAAADLTFLLAKRAFGQPISVNAALLSPGLWVGFLALLSLWRIAAGPGGPRRAWTCLWVAGGAISIALAIAGGGLAPEYGDAVWLRRHLEDTAPNPRWLAGHALVLWAHRAVFGWPFLASRIADPAAAAGAFLRVASTLAMAGATLALLRSAPRRRAVFLPCLLPIWLVFAAGYLEYYPFVAPALLAALAWLFDRPLGERDPARVGVLLAVLPLLYAGFAPVALLAFLAYLASAPRRAPRAGLWAVGAAIAGVTAFWPGGMASFLPSLQGSMNWGDRGTAWAPYRGQAASADSIFFSLPFVLAGTHVRDVAFMGFLSGTHLALALPVAAALVDRSGFLRRLRRHRRDARLWLGVALAVLSLAFPPLMIPKLGPARDFDLFFATPVVLAFLAGRWLDAARPEPRLGPWPGIGFSALAGAAAAGLWLLLHGVTPP